MLTREQDECEKKNDLSLSDKLKVLDLIKNKKNAKLKSQNNLKLQVQVFKY